MSARPVWRSWSISTTPPVAQNDAVSTDEDTSLLIDVLADNGNGIDSDPEGNLDPTATISLTSPALGTLTNNNNGTFTFDPNGAFESLAAGESSQVDFNYQIADTEGDTNSATVTITVQGVNDAPAVNAAAGSVMIDEGQTAAKTGTFDDIDSSDHVVISASMGTITFQDSGNAGNWSWQFPGVDDLATTVVTITANDGNGGITTTTFDLTVANVAPTPNITSIGAVRVEGTSIAVTAAASDPAGANDTLTYDWQVFKGTTPFASQSSVGGFNFSFTPDDNESYKIVLSVSDEDGGSAVTSQTISVANVAPSVTVSPATQNVQYSDSIADVTFTALDVPADTMNATVSFSTDGGTFTAGLPDALSLVPNSESLMFAGGDDQVGTGTWTLSGIADLDPALTYTIRVTVSDEDGGSSDIDTIINVDQEDARAQYVGPLFVSTDPKYPDNGTVQLRAVIRDITAVIGDPDSEEGNITKATVTFFNRDTDTVIAAGVPINLIDTDIKTGVAIFDWDVTLNQNDTSKSFRIGIIVDGFYDRNAPVEDVVVTVARPDGDFISGGGYFINENSAGTYAGADDLTTNFGFNIKYNKKLTNLLGHFNGIVRQTDGTVLQIKSNASDSLVVNPTAGSNGGATFISKANLTDVTDPENPVVIAGNLTLIVNVTDNGEPGDSDTIGFTLWDESELLVSSNWDGAQTLEQLLDGGNIAVHTKNNALHVAGAAADFQANSTLLTPDQLQPFVDLAISQWVGSSIDQAAVNTLSQVEFRTADLSETTLGLAFGNTVWIDQNAAGFGWSFDTNIVQPGLVDLLSVISHELGHVLGFDHDEMGSTLSRGGRYLVSSGLSTETRISDSSKSGIGFYAGNRSSSSTDDSDSEQNDVDILESLSVMPLIDTGREEKNTNEDSAKNASDIISADDKSADDLFSDFNESLLDDLLAV